MPKLREVLGGLGFEDVTTYVQSGNVVFRTRARKAEDLSRAIEKAVADEFGVAASVLLRTSRELERVFARNPFPDESDPTRLLVVFLERAPARGAASRLDPERSPPDRFALHGREIYLHAPNGFGRSKLTLDYFERRLGGKGTVRNWRTVTELLSLAHNLSRE